MWKKILHCQHICRIWGDKGGTELTFGIRKGQILSPFSPFPFTLPAFSFFEMSEETSTSSSECIRDGILDVFYDLSQLTNKERWKYTRLYLCLVDFHARLTTASNLQLQFDLYFLEHPKRSCVKAVKEWKKDGMVRIKNGLLDLGFMTKLDEAFASKHRFP